LYMKLFWSGTDDNEVACRLLDYVPEQFSGCLLDVPVGTAVFTAEKWRQLDRANITCLDYSAEMLELAKQRLKDSKHITCVQGDVGHLPMPDAYFDIVVSMNGFHAFPDKDAAFKETWRVLKPGGSFIACFYIKGKSPITDGLVRHVLAKKGWFTPPFCDEQELRAILSKLYSDTELHIDGSIVWFKCIK